MQKSMIAMLATLTMALTLGAIEVPKEPIKDTNSISRVESRLKDDRGPGILGDYWWANRFISRRAQIDGEFARKTIDVAMVGDSIIHFWEWKHKASWGKFCQNRKVLNLGYGGDLTYHLNWRIDHGELEGYKAKNVVLLIGTNNNYSDKSVPNNVAYAITKIVESIKEKQPQAKIILYALFPRGANAESKFHAKPRARNDATNALLKEWAASHPEVDYVDIGDKFLDKTGWVPKSLMGDEIHPTDAGYDIWMVSLNEHLRK